MHQADAVRIVIADDHPIFRKAPPRARFGLTPRELEITSAVVSGFSNKEIARKFVRSENTIKHHLTNIFDKVGASNRLELALFAVHHRLLEERDSVGTVNKV